MTTAPASPVWLARLLRAAAAGLSLGAVATWVTPVNVPGRNLIPVACGSPAAPDTDRLTDFVCGAHLAGVRSVAVALVLSAGVLVLLSEVVLPRVAVRSWVVGAATAAAWSVPALVLSTTALFTTVARQSADGTLIRCGTAIAPANDAISRSLCADLPGRQKSLALFGILLSGLALLGAAYVTHERTPSPQGTDETTGRDESS